MEPEAFHKLIYTIVNSKDSEEKRNAEKLYFDFRAQNPSDDFVKLLLNECVTEPDTQKAAQIFLNQDLTQNSENSCLNRMRDPTIAREYIVQLLQFGAANPSTFIAKIGAQYYLLQNAMNRRFDEVQSFISQAAGNANSKVRNMAACMLSEILDSCSLESLDQINPLALL